MNRIGNNLQHWGPNEDLVRAFVGGAVEFIVVGGLAVSWYCPDRQADDMDLLVDSTPDNSKRISAALSSLGLNGHDADSFARPDLQVPIKGHYYAELLTPKKEGPSFAEVVADATKAALFDVPVRVASPAQLIRMKQQAIASAEAQAAKHLADIERLEQYAG